MCYLMTGIRSPLIVKGGTTDRTPREVHTPLNSVQPAHLTFKKYALSAMLVALATLLFVFIGPNSASGAAKELIVYSGRSESLVAPLFEAFTEETGIEVRVRYGDTAELAATILEEGPNTPADIYWAQDAGALGALAKEGRLRTLDAELLNQVDSRLRSPDGEWVATSGRARVVAYNTRTLSPEDLPESIWGFTDPKWRGKIGWPPTNGSFQAFVTALRVIEGDARAEAWLKGILANEPKVYRNNTAAVDAVSRGEVQVAFVNHYYLYRFLKEQGDAFPARNYYTNADAGSIINVAGVGILDRSDNVDAARRFVDFLLSERAQTHFSAEVNEYPVAVGLDIPIHPDLVPLSEVAVPEIDLSDLDDLEGTLELLQKVGVL